MAMAMVHCDVVMLMSTEGNDGDTLGSDTVLVYDTSDFPAHVVAWLWEGKGDLWCWPIGDQSSKISLVKTKDSPCTCSFRKRWWVWSTKHCWKNIKEELAVVSSLRISSPQKHSHPVWLRLRNIINFTMICWIAMVTHTMPFASMHRLPSALEINPLGHLLSAKASGASPKASCNNCLRTSQTKHWQHTSSCHWTDFSAVEWPNRLAAQVKWCCQYYQQVPEKCDS